MLGFRLEAKRKTGEVRVDGLLKNSDEGHCEQSEAPNLRPFKIRELEIATSLTLLAITLDGRFFSNLLDQDK